MDKRSTKNRLRMYSCPFLFDNYNNISNNNNELIIFIRDGIKRQTKKNGYFSSNNYHRKNGLDIRGQTTSFSLLFFNVNFGTREK